MTEGCPTLTLDMRNDQLSLQLLCAVYPQKPPVIENLRLTMYYQKSVCKLTHWRPYVVYSTVSIG